MYLFFTIIFVFLLSTAYAAYSLAPWIPTRQKDLARICELAELKAGEKFYDLGCGEGRLVFYTAENFKTNSAGLELSLFFYLICRIKSLFKKNLNTKFLFKNLYNQNLADADAVFIFAASSKHISERLKTKLKKELKPGARIISYVFPIINWQPTKISKPTDKDLSIYLYCHSRVGGNPE